MSKAIGMIEFKTTATGITAADAMVKTSEVEIVEAQTVCPGKYIAIITGDLSAVKAAVDAAVTPVAVVLNSIIPIALLIFCTSFLILCNYDPAICHFGNFTGDGCMDTNT